MGVAEAVIDQLRKRGHEPLPHGALAEDERDDWAWASEAAARDVAEGRAEQAIVCCWTGTGASIAANKVDGVRAALCLDAQTADGARKWNDANALAISLRATSEAELAEILDAWFGGEPSADADDAANVEHLAEIEGGEFRDPGDTHGVRRLLPDEAETTVAEQLAELDLKALALPDRPYLVLNFATTLDGRAAIAGRSGPIGSATDTEMLQRLRTRVDAVMIGAGTMRAERYGRIVSDPHLRAYRERTGLADDPLAVIVSNRLELPWDAGLFTDGGGRVVIFTASEQDPPETATPVTVVRHPDGVELDRALGWLAHEGGIRSVLCEGGPTLHGRLREGGLADELFLTIAPKIAGGEGPRILEGALADVDEVELAWLLESKNELFARYRGIVTGPHADRRGGSFQPWTSSPRPRSSPSVSA